MQQSASREEKIKVLKEARRLILQDGWVRGVFKDETGRRCLTGAVYGACSKVYPTTERGLRQRSVPVVGLLSKLTAPLTVTDWNDNHAVNQDQVLAIIDDALALLEQERELAYA